MTGLPFASRRTLNRHPAPHLADAISVTRFWSMVDIAGADDCWLWQGDQHKGYGVFVFQGRRFGSHELALSFATGEARPDGFDTCHECDTPPCCNPAHLRFDTRQGNVDDSIKRGRNSRGEGHPDAVLTDEEVVAIRILRRNGARQLELADRFGVRASYISQLVNGNARLAAGGPLTGRSKYFNENLTKANAS